MGVFGTSLREALAFCAFILGTPVLLAVVFDGLAWAIRKLSKFGGKK